jgi:uncharacterized repeat protein (TIGR03803 family)
MKPIILFIVLMGCAVLPSSLSTQVREFDGKLNSIGASAVHGVRAFGASLPNDTGTSSFSQAHGTTTNQQQAANLYTETVLYSFCSLANCADGDEPNAGLIEDASGNFYGTTSLGGAITGGHPYGSGTVFKLDSGGNYSVLYSFCSQTNCPDGEVPYAGVIEDAAGNLYGTTHFGGAHGAGNVFKLDNAGHYSALYDFCSQANCADGGYPYGGLIEDAAGNLFGTTDIGGATSLNCPSSSQYPGCGTVYKLDSAGNYTVLYSFCAEANCADGRGPYAGLIEDASGNLYGTTFFGGTSDGGTVFKLDSTGKYSALHSFCAEANCADGFYPYAGLIEDLSGNLYGTTYNGGATNNGLAPGGGTVFKLDSAGNFSVVHIFCNQPNCADGGNPQAGVIADSSGSLYGTASNGGNHGGSGTVYEIDKAGNYTTLYSFCAQTNCTDGYLPYAGLVHDASGSFYGTTFSGGANAQGGVDGVIFKLTTPDFTIGSNPTTVTIGSPGQQGTTTIMITPSGGFNQAITFSCGGLPTGASCSFTPANVTPNGGAVNTTLSLATTPTSSAIPRPPFGQKHTLFFALVIPGLLMLGRTSRGKRSSARRVGGMLVLVVLLFGFLAIGLEGCGGGNGGGSGGSGGGSGGGTPVGAYTVTVTGTASGLSHTTALTLVVK